MKRKEHTLKEYLDFGGIAPEAFARMIGVTGSTIRGIINGRLPSFETATKIEEFTHGLVTHKSIVSTLRTLTGKKQEPQNPDQAVEASNKT